MDSARRAPASVASSSMVYCFGVDNGAVAATSQVSFHQQRPDQPANVGLMGVVGIPERTENSSPRAASTPSTPACPGAGAAVVPDTLSGKSLTRFGAFVPAHLNPVGNLEAHQLLQHQLHETRQEFLTLLLSQHLPKCHAAVGHRLHSDIDGHTSSQPYRRARWPPFPLDYTQHLRSGRLELAEGILHQSAVGSKEAVFISDFSSLKPAYPAVTDTFNMSDPILIRPSRLFPEPTDMRQQCRCLLSHFCFIITIF